MKDGTELRIFDETVPAERMACHSRLSRIPTMSIWIAFRSAADRPNRDYWKKITVERLPDGTPGRCVSVLGRGLHVSDDMACRNRPWRTIPPTRMPTPEDLVVASVGNDPMVARSYRSLLDVDGSTFLVRWEGLGLEGSVSVFALDAKAGGMLPKKLTDDHPIRTAATLALPEPARSASNRWLPEPDGWERWPFCLAEASDLGWEGRGSGR